MENRATLSATNVLIAITVLMYFVQTNMTYGSAYLGLNLNFSEHGFYWQALSSMFAHGGFGHLFMNMSVLWIFGNLIERGIGSKSFVALYLISGILTSLLSYTYIYFLDNSVNLVGASGAICALMGYVAYLDRYQRKGIIIWVALISIVPLFIGLPIAWYAHFIGLAIGFIYALIKH